ncbi:MAG: bifunctional hydroxymethylpyrimidine kinase/phosphomethylpyrimidine kinase [Acidimicrobiales bacterium]
MTTGRRLVALTIAGTDSGGGAGVFADLKTFEAHGVWGTAAVVAVTAQNTVGVQAFKVLPAALVRAQVASVAGDIGVQAAKTGMLATAEMVATVAAAVSDHLDGVPLVVDTVLVSKHGDTLLADDAVSALRQDLLPLATLVTPNLPEAAALVGFAVDSRAAMEEAARELLVAGARAVLVKGGHLSGDRAPDCFVAAGGRPVWLDGPRVPGRHTHGTGCTLSAAVTARLARGESLERSVAGAKAFVTRAIEHGIDLGAGVGPVDPTG